MSSTLMSGFPSADADQVSLANWRIAPYSKWAFQHVREIVPSANIPNAPSDVWKLVSEPKDFSSFRFEHEATSSGHSGERKVAHLSALLLDDQISQRHLIEPGQIELVQQALHAQLIRPEPRWAKIITVILFAAVRRGKRQYPTSESIARFNQLEIHSRH